jgi:hypothetical protein
VWQSYCFGGKSTLNFATCRPWSLGLPYRRSRLTQEKTFPLHIWPLKLWRTLTEYVSLRRHGY